jgi:hypothetical protein
MFCVPLLVIEVAISPKSLIKVQFSSLGGEASIIGQEEVARRPFGICVGLQTKGRRREEKEEG